jgi:rubrerythrin
MRFETTRDVLDYVKQFHRKARNLYSQLADHEEQERLKLLLTYLSRHENHLAKSLADYEEETSAKILNTWFQYVPDQALLEPINHIDIEPNLSVDEVIELAMRLDNCLIELYKEMIDHSAAISEVKEVFQNLLEMEQQEQHQLARSRLGTFDI